MLDKLGGFGHDTHVDSGEKFEGKKSARKTNIWGEIIETCYVM